MQPGAMDPLAARDVFVDQARKQAVDDVWTAATATSRPPTSIEQAEIAWNQAHRAGGVNSIGDNIVELWNFDVGSATLKPEHIQALNDLLRPVRLLLKTYRGTYEGTFVATGYASTTGGASENDRLANARAESVSSWLQDAGVLNGAIVQSGWPGMPAGNSTEPAILARNRSVTVERVDPPAPPPPSPDSPPSYTLVTPEPNMPPIVLTKPDAVTLKFPFEAPVFEMPPPEELVGEIKVSGELQLVFSDQKQREDFAVELEMGEEGLIPELKGKVSDGVKTVLDLTPKHGEEPSSFAFGFEFGEKEPLKILFQAKPAFLYVEKTLRSLDFGTVNILGTPVSMKFEGKIFGEVGPGPALLKRFGLEAAGTEEAVVTELTLGEVAAPVLAALSSAVVMYLVVTSQTWAEQQAINYALQLADRYGFAGRVALDVSGATRDRADAWLQGWSSTPDFSRDAVGKGYSRATSELKQLRDSGMYDARIKQLVATYGVDGSGKTDLDYDHVADRIFRRLGGLSSTGPVPSISAL